MTRYRKTVKCNERSCHHSVGAGATRAKFPDHAERRAYVEDTTQQLLAAHYAAKHPGKTPPAPELQKVLAEVAA